MCTMTKSTTFIIPVQTRRPTTPSLATDVLTSPWCLKIYLYSSFPCSILTLTSGTPTKPWWRYRVRNTTSGSFWTVRHALLLASSTWIAAGFHHTGSREALRAPVHCERPLLRLSDADGVQHIRVEGFHDERFQTSKSSFRNLSRIAFNTTDLYFLHSS